LPFDVRAGGLERLGKRRWRKHTLAVIALLRAALEPDYVVLGGGNAKKLGELPAGTRLGANVNAFAGGFKLWDVAAADRPEGKTHDGLRVGRTRLKDGRPRALARAE